MRRSLLLLILWAGPALAQEEAEKIPARIDWFPYLMGDANHGLLIIGHFQVSRQAEYNQRFAHDWILGAEAAWGTRGSRLITVKMRAPFLVEGWRFSADLGAGREGRFGYFGQGEGGESGLAEADHPKAFFRVHRTRFYGRAEVSRRLRQGLYASLGAGLTWFKFRSVDTDGLFATDYPGGELSGTDATGRLSLVFDTRNNELIPANGVLLEAGIHGGTGRYSECGTVCESGGYLGAYANFRGYFSPWRGIVFAGRAAFRTLSEEAPLDARYDFSGWERDLSVFGGFDSNRGLIRGRLAGRRLVMTSADIRYDLVDGGDYGALTVLAFLDAGKVAGGEPAQTFSKWKVGAGGGLAIRVLRQAILTLNFAKGPDGFNFTMGNGWAF